MFLWKQLYCMSIFRVRRKHIKSVSVNRGSDFTSTSPLDFIGKRQFCPALAHAHKWLAVIFSKFTPTSSSCILLENLRWTHWHTRKPDLWNFAKQIIMNRKKCLWNWMKEGGMRFAMIVCACMQAGKQACLANQNRSDWWFNIYTFRLMAPRCYWEVKTELEL